MTDDQRREYELHVSFYIDTDGYTDRDREMFVCGVEYQMILAELESGMAIQRTIHTENASRIRMLCGKFRRMCQIEDTGDVTWSYLNIGPRV